MKEKYDRSWRPRLAPFLVALLAATTLFAVAPEEAQANTGYGDFRARNYATGFEINNFWWRGYAFTVTRDTTVTHMFGGSGPNCASGFSGGIFEASWQGTPGSSLPRVGALMGSVSFDPMRDPGPLIEEEMVAFDSPFTLVPGQLYFITQGRSGPTGSGCHYASTAIDYQNLAIGSPIIDTWYPQADAAYQVNGAYTVPQMTGQPIGGVTPIRTLVGFRYETDVETPDFDPTLGTGNAFSTGATTAIVDGMLADTGAPTADDNTTLYFEVSRAADFNDSSTRLIPAQPFIVAGPALNVPFSATIPNLVDGVRYYYRAVAINEGGRTTAETRDFIHDGSASNEIVQAYMTDANGTVTPSIRAVIPGETTTFQVNALPNFGVDHQVSGTCPPGGTWSGNTYTTAIINSSCSLYFSTKPLAILDATLALIDYIDADGSGSISPGDLLAYRVTVTHQSGDSVLDLMLNSSLASLDIILDSCTGTVLSEGQSCTIEGLYEVSYFNAQTGEVIHEVEFNTFQAQRPLGASMSSTVDVPMSVSAPPFNGDGFPEITGFANLAPGAQVQLRLTHSTGVEDITITLDGDQSFTYVPSPGLPDGDYTAELRFTNQLGKLFVESASGSVNTAVPALVATGPSGFINNPRPTISGTAEANQEVTVEIGPLSTVIVADDHGAFSFTPGEDLPEGSHLWMVGVTNIYGNSNTVSGGFSLLTTPPVGTLSAPEDGFLTNNPLLAFVGSADEETTVEIFINGAPVHTVEMGPSSSFSHTLSSALADGSYEVALRITDRAGNQIVTAARTVQIDTVIPAGEFEAPLAGSITNEVRPAFTGTTKAYAQVELEVNGSSIGSTQADEDGNWNLTPTADLSEGIQNVSAHFSDVFGNQASAALSFEVDITPPHLVIISPVEGYASTLVPALVEGEVEAGAQLVVTVNGAPADAVVINDTQWQLSPGALSRGTYEVVATATDQAGNISTASRSFLIVDALVLQSPEEGSYLNQSRPIFVGTGEPGDAIEVRFNGQIFDSFTVGTDGTFSYQAASHLPDGSYSFHFEGAHGNSAQVSIEIDTVPPAGAIGAPVAGLLTNDQRPEISGTGEADAALVLTLNGNLLYEGHVDSQGNWSFLLDDDLLEGEYVLVATFRDLAGNEDFVQISFEIDITPPHLVIESPADEMISVDAPTGASGQAEAGAHFELYLNDELLDDFIIGTDGSWNVDFMDSLTRGVYELRAQAIDGAGNESIEESSFQVVDAVAITSPEDSLLTNDPMVLVSGTGEPGDTIQLLHDANEDFLVVDGNGNWFMESARNLDDGVHTFEAIATHGPSASITITVDTMAPEGEITSPEANQHLSTLQPLVEGTGEAGAAVEIRLNDEVVATLEVDSIGNWSWQPDADLSEGAYDLVVIFTDGAGNQSEEELHFVLDVTPPYVIISAPEEGAILKDSPEFFLGQVEELAQVEIYLNGDLLVAFEADEAVGSAFADWSLELTEVLERGDYTLEVIASDEAGNTSTATRVFTIVDGVLITRPSEGSILRTARPLFEGLGEPGDEVELFLNGTSVATVVVDENGAWSWQPEQDLGDHEDYVLRVEGAGDSSHTRGFRVVVATSEILISAPLHGTATNDPTPVVSGSAAPGAEVTIHIDGEAVATVVADTNGQWSWESSELADGDYEISVTSLDEAEELQQDQVEITIDTVPPVVTATITEPGDEEPVVVSGTTEPGVEVVIYVDGEPLGSTTADEDGNYSFVIPTDDLLPGDYDVDVEVTDQAGNTSLVRLGFTIPEVPEVPEVPEHPGDGDIEEDDELLEAYLAGGGCSSTSQDQGAPFMLLFLVGLFLLRQRSRKENSSHQAC